jgi:hypothetical protein
VEEQENDQEVSHVDDEILQAQSIHDQDQDDSLEKISPGHGIMADMTRKDTIDTGEDEEVGREESAVDISASTETIVTSNTKKNQRYNL